MKTTKTQFTSIDQYIKTFSKDIQQKLETMRKIVKEVAPEATEAIAYQMPTFKLLGNLVHFAAFKNHIGFYPIPSGIEAFKQELSEFATSKGGIKFPLDKPIPVELVKKIVTYRVSENMQKENEQNSEKSK